MIGEFAQVCVKNRDVTTDMFLDFMENRIGKDARQIAEAWLDFGGIGIPN